VLGWEGEYLVLALEFMLFVVRAPNDR